MLPITIDSVVGSREVTILNRITFGLFLSTMLLILEVVGKEALTAGTLIEPRRLTHIDSGLLFYRVVSETRLRIGKVTLLKIRDCLDYVVVSPIEPSTTIRCPLV